MVKKIATCITLSLMLIGLTNCAETEVFPLTDEETVQQGSQNNNNHVVKPAIGTQPESVIVDSGATVKLTVIASGPDISYQWFKDNSPILGAFSAGKTLEFLADEDSIGKYHVEVTNPGGTAISDLASVNLSGSDAKEVCVPQTSVQCSSPNGQGWQLCSADGSILGPCQAKECNFGNKKANGKCPLECEQNIGDNCAEEGTWEEKIVSAANGWGGCSAAGHHVQVVSEMVADPEPHFKHTIRYRLLAGYSCQAGYTEFVLSEPQYDLRYARGGDDLKVQINIDPDNSFKAPTIIRGNCKGSLVDASKANIRVSEPGSTKGAGNFNNRCN